MVATTVTQTTAAHSALRRVNPRRDLAAIADLIEVCFADTLDGGGRSMLREMRVLASSHLLVWTLARVAGAAPVMDGFVWVEDGRLVGNVSIAPTGYGAGLVIANVAVYPEYRRRGIARRLMDAALAQVAQRDQHAVLQVDAANSGARRLYEQLGFHTQRIFTRWRRAAYHRTPLLAPDPQLVRPLRRGDITPLFDLVQQTRPDSRGGIGWLRPATPRDIRPPRPGMLYYLLSGKQVRYWVVPGLGGALDGALRVEQRMGSTTLLCDLFVRDSRQGELEAPLLRHLLRAYPQRPFVIDHPADHTGLDDIFQQHQFRPERTLVHMLRPAQRPAPAGS